MEQQAPIQTGDVFENEYMTIVVSEVTENKITYSAGSVKTTNTVLKTEFELKMMNEDFEKVGSQEVSQTAKVVKPNPEDNNEKEMHVTEDGETQTFTQDEWESRRDTRTRLWRSLERKDGLVWVRTADWMNDKELNKVKVGRGFYGHKVGETDKAINFEVPASPESHNAEAETVWVPKSQARIHELK